MTWNKKLDSRAYDPIAAVTLTPDAGAVAGLAIVEANYTVDNNYLCSYSLRVTFQQTTAPAGSFKIPSPLPFSGGSDVCCGAGQVLDASAPAWRPMMVQRDATNNTIILLVPGGVGVASGHSLSIAGHFFVR
jgi:hypothetical protein